MYPGLSLCRIAVQEKGQYQIVTEECKQAAQISGRFQYEAKTASDYPAVGDYVMADLNGSGTAVIHVIYLFDFCCLCKAIVDEQKVFLITSAHNKHSGASMLSSLLERPRLP